MTDRTGRKSIKSAGAARPGEALLRAVFERAPTATAVLTTNGLIAFANEAFARLLGLQPAACVGMDYAQIVDGPLPTLPPDGGIAHSERLYRRADGQSIFVLEARSPARDGDAAYTIVQAVDIDTRKRAEDELATREARWNSALEGAGQGVWDHDRRTGIGFYSRMWKAMRGHDPDEELDGSVSTWIERVHPDDRERVLATISRQDSGKLPFNMFDYRERHHDGHWMWILSRGRTIEWSEAGQPIRVIGTDTDISALKSVESQLAEEKERLRVTLRSIGDGVITTDGDGRITFLNPAAGHLTGWQPGDAVGQLVKDVFHVVAEVSGSRVPNSVVECLNRGETFRLDQDVLLIARDGERRNIRETAAPVITPDGEVIGAILVFQDVTASRALQRQLAHSATHDGLTGLPNRTAFEDALKAAVESAGRENRAHALCFIDLDRFKLVNDGAGHAAGDALLQRIGDVIRRGCRANDFAARIGGDEFALLLADCALAEAKTIAEELAASIAAVRYFWGGVFYDAGASVGVTVISGDKTSPSELMDEADAACYAAKAAGRNSVRVYDGEQSGPGRYAKAG